MHLIEVHYHLWSQAFFSTKHHHRNSIMCLRNSRTQWWTVAWWPRTKLLLSKTLLLQLRLKTRSGEGCHEFDSFFWLGPTLPLSLFPNPMLSWLSSSFALSFVLEPPSRPSEMPTLSQTQNWWLLCPWHIQYMYCLCCYFPCQAIISILSSTPDDDIVVESICGNCSRFDSSSNDFICGCLTIVRG